MIGRKTAEHVGQELDNLVDFVWWARKETHECGCRLARFPRERQVAVRNLGLGQTGLCGCR